MVSAPPCLLVPYEGYESFKLATHLKGKLGIDVRLQLTVPVAVLEVGSEKHKGAITPGEITILDLMSRDIGPKEGAVALCISIRAMRLRLQKIRSKLGTRSNEAAVARAFRLGLIA